MTTAFTQAETIFRRNRGLLRASEAIRLGVAPRTLYAMRNAGVLTQIGHGLYRLADLPPLSQPDLITVALKIPRGVICLISALAFHDLTTQIPHEVYVALRNNAEKPRLSYPPLRLFWFSEEAYEVGIDEHRLDSVPVKIYCVEKTIADCFKFRNKVGLDVVLEALKRYRGRRGYRVDRLLHFARICRVENVMRPYLEALE